jgi:myo-inositol 2-dehydrogenase/D-chiro-inositol 1-dehydrogenase
VLGSKATVRVAPHRRVHVEWLTPDAATRDYVADFVEQFPEAYVRELEAFAAAVRDEGPVLVTGEDALGACVLALAAERSRQQGRPVRLRRSAAAGRTRHDFD